MAAVKRVRKSKRNRGGYLLERLGLPYREIAEKIGCSPGNISHWVNGKTKPDEIKRALISSLWPISVESWDEPVKKPIATAGTPEGEALANIPEGIKAKTAYLESRLNRLLVSEAEEENPLKSLGMLDKATTIAARLARMSGEDAVSTGKILKSPAWHRIVTAITEAVKPHPPQVAEDIAKALRALEASE